ncbi:MAG: 30S ribosomal protein S8 [Cytophagales bacterium]|nr:30S ribosomal protein S8 [Cytophagales bacterium]
MKYNPETKRVGHYQIAASKYSRFTSVYKHADACLRVMNGLGVAILSTSKGVITDKEARNLNVGGEVLCYIY